MPPPRTGGDYDEHGLPMTGLGKKTDAKVGPHGEQTQILTPEQREQYRVVAGPNGELIYPNQGNRPVHSPGGQAIYVMDKNGNVYVHEDPSYMNIHHSSLASGEEFPLLPGTWPDRPTAWSCPAFEMNNGSGHYNRQMPIPRGLVMSSRVRALIPGTRLYDVTDGKVTHPPGTSGGLAPARTRPVRQGGHPSALGKR